MDGPRPAAAAQPPTDRIEGNIGPARIGATLLNTSSDPLTHTLDHTGGSMPSAEPEDYRLSLYHEEGSRSIQRLDATVLPRLPPVSTSAPGQKYGGAGAFASLTSQEAARRAAESMEADASPTRVCNPSASLRAPTPLAGAEATDPSMPDAMVAAPTASPGAPGALSTLQTMHECAYLMRGDQPSIAPSRAVEQMQPALLAAGAGASADGALLPLAACGDAPRRAVLDPIPTLSAMQESAPLFAGSARLGATFRNTSTDQATLSAATDAPAGEALLPATACGGMLRPAALDNSHSACVQNPMSAARQLAAEGAAKAARFSAALDAHRTASLARARASAARDAWQHIADAAAEHAGLSPFYSAIAEHAMAAREAAERSCHAAPAVALPPLLEVDAFASEPSINHLHTISSASEAPAIQPAAASLAPVPLLPTACASSPPPGSFQPPSSPGHGEFEHAQCAAFRAASAVETASAVAVERVRLEAERALLELKLQVETARARSAEAEAATARAAASRAASEAEATAARASAATLSPPPTPPVPEPPLDIHSMGVPALLAMVKLPAEFESLSQPSAWYMQLPRATGRLLEMVQSSKVGFEAVLRQFATGETRKQSRMGATDRPEADCVCEIQGFIAHDGNFMTAHRSIEYAQHWGAFRDALLVQLFECGVKTGSLAAASNALMSRVVAACSSVDVLSSSRAEFQRQRTARTGDAGMKAVLKAIDDKFIETYASAQLDRTFNELVWAVGDSAHTLAENIQNEGKRIYKSEDKLLDKFASCVVDHKPATDSGPWFVDRMTVMHIYQQYVYKNTGYTTMAALLGALELDVVWGKLPLATDFAWRDDASDGGTLSPDDKPDDDSNRQDDPDDDPAIWYPPYPAE